MVYRIVQKNFLSVFDVTTTMLVKLICLCEYNFHYNTFYLNISGDLLNSHCYFCKRKLFYKKDGNKPSEECVPKLKYFSEYFFLAPILFYTARIIMFLIQVAFVLGVAYLIR